VLDFGISQQVEESLTQKGTDMYKAPEVLDNSPHNNKVKTVHKTFRA
jgi:hypothetical protein